MLVTSLKICTGGFFFLLGATTLVESWPSQQFLSTWGDLGLVLPILWVSSSSGRSWHRLPIGTWVFLLVFLWMVSICVFSNNSLPSEAILDLFCPFYEFRLLQVVPDIVFPSGRGSSYWSSCEWFPFMCFLTIPFHLRRSWTCSVHFMGFVFFRSFLTSSSHRDLGLPTGLPVNGFHLFIF